MDINEYKMNKKGEKVIKVLNNFLNRNKNYAIRIYLKNANTDLIIGRFFISANRDYEDISEKEYRLSWDGNNSSLTIPYNEIIACYEETDEYGSQSVHIVVKFGIIIEFECVGDRI